MRVGQRGHAVIDPEALERGRQDRREGRGGRGVRILVGRHVETLGACRLEPGDRLAGAAPDGARPALEMRDLETCRRTSRADRGDRFVERREEPIGLVAHVGRVEPASCGRRGDERLELARVRVHPGRVDEPGRQADRARVERRLDPGDHGGHLLGRRRARLAAHDRCADRPVADEEGDVRPEPLVGDALEVLPERPPARGQAVRAKRELDDLAPAVVSGASESPQLPDSWVV